MHATKYIEASRAAETGYSNHDYAGLYASTATPATSSARSDYYTASGVYCTEELHALNAAITSGFGALGIATTPQHQQPTL